MLLKLLKYDFRSMWKQFQVIWPAALILALVNRFTLFGVGGDESIVGEWVGIISMFLFGGVCFAMVVVSFVFVLSRFYKGLLGDEGYLMHTLPVKSWQLVLSKLICALSVTVVNAIVGFGAMFLMMPLSWKDVFDPRLWEMLVQSIVEHPDGFLYMVEFCIMMLAMFAVTYTVIYLSMAIGHLFSKHRVLMSVVAFFGIDIVGNLVLLSLGWMGSRLSWTGILSSVSTLSGHAALWTSIGAMLIPAVIMFAATSWILSHRLNLE